MYVLYGMEEVMRVVTENSVYHVVPHGDHVVIKKIDGTDCPGLPVGREFKTKAFSAEIGGFLETPDGLSTSRVSRIDP